MARTEAVVAGFSVASFGFGAVAMPNFFLKKNQ
jgi:hypothetical protein